MKNKENSSKPEEPNLPNQPDKNIPVKPDINPDPTKIKPGINEPGKKDPTRIDEPSPPSPTEPKTQQPEKEIANQRRIIVPKGTRQETGVDRYIKKTENTEIIKDAKINNKAEQQKK